MGKDGNWQAKIVDSFDFVGSVRYIIEVTAQSGSYLIRRRYNNFYNLHKALASAGVNTDALHLPPKCYSLLGPSAQFLEARLSMLQAYLDALSSSASQELSQHPLTLAFISLSNNSSSNSNGLTDDAAQELPAEPLPFQAKFATLPPGELNVLCQGSKLCTVAAYARIQQDGECALFRLYLLGQMIEICTDAQGRITAYDSQRLSVESSVLVLRSMVPELEQMLQDAESTGNDRLVRYTSDILSNVQRGIEWGRGAEDREIAEIGRLHKDSVDVTAANGSKRRRLDWYKNATEAVLSDCRCSGDAADRARELIMEICDEMAVRSQVGEVSAVKRLREYRDALDDVCSQLRAEKRAPPPATPERVAAGLRRRVETLSARTEAAVLNRDAESARAALEEERVLEGDIAGWKSEFDSVGGGKFAAVEPSVEKTLEIAQHLRTSLELVVQSYSTNERNVDKDGSDVELV